MLGKTLSILILVVTPSNYDAIHIQQVLTSFIMCGALKSKLYTHSYVQMFFVKIVLCENCGILYTQQVLTFLFI